MSFRETMARVLTLPFFIAGICWFWIRRAFVTGVAWESEQFPHPKER